MLGAAFASSALAACDGCDRDSSRTASGTSVHDTTPTLRLYLASDLAGALEPCGCTKDQLGGLDHLAAFVASQSKDAPNHLVLASGSSFFIDPVLDAERAMQDKWKAVAIAHALKALGLAAFAPGFNDFSAGREELEKLAENSGGTLLAAGLEGARAISRTIIERGGLKVGIVGLSDPRDASGKAPTGITVPPPERFVELMQAEVAALEQDGAVLIVGLVAMQRGAALRLADGIPELDVLLIGKPLGRGPANTAQPLPELVNGVLVVETANHGQTVAVVDVFARERSGPLKLADAGGVAKAGQVGELSRRVRELEHRINGWEKGGKVDLADLAARKEELATIVRQRDAVMGSEGSVSGNFFRFGVHEVRERLGADASVVSLMRDYYQRVNTHNKTAFASLLPLSVAKGQAAFIGVDACTDCHAEARAVWDKTAHAHAYKTLSDDFKEYNLECVGCHVTGYGKPGGSTVAHVDKLRDVQCEDCHGPGSLHAAAPEKQGLIALAPEPKTCVERCHHPPHVEGFDPVAKMDLVLGPGHGE
ncbi:MAG: hypothetical protein EXR75_02265 [Myxococcales bacterium]|nr:hypothetical protein [Myxococcales bacterium]